MFTVCNVLRPVIRNRRGIGYVPLTGRTNRITVWLVSAVTFTEIA